MRRQRGIALITAILLVALATILAATIGYENAMTARHGTATFAFDQSLEVSKAAEAIAAYALRATKQNNKTTTYPGQPWSTPYGPVDLVPYEFDCAASLFDGLVAIGDHPRIESTAPAWLIPGTYVEPFALRALGVARADRQLIGIHANQK